MKRGSRTKYKTWKINTSIDPGEGKIIFVTGTTLENSVRRYIDEQKSESSTFDIQIEVSHHFIILTVTDTYMEDESHTWKRYWKVL